MYKILNIYIMQYFQKGILLKKISYISVCSKILLRLCVDKKCENYI